MIDPELSLWRSVIWQAVVDATAQYVRSATSNGAITKQQRDHARAWLVGDSADFRKVCDLAEMNPRVVQRGARMLKRDGWVRKSTEEYQHQNHERFSLKVA